MHLVNQNGSLILVSNSLNVAFNKVGVAKGYKTTLKRKVFSLKEGRVVNLV